MVQLTSLSDVPTFGLEPKAVLRTVVSPFQTCEDLEKVMIDVTQIPEILSSFVPSWNQKDELRALVSGMDEEETGQLDLTKVSQIILHFLKKEAETVEDFVKVSLKISTQLCTSSSEAMNMMIVTFYPQIVKAVEEGQCTLQ